MIKKLLKLLGVKDTISFKQGFELTELPIVTLYQKDKKFNFLLDTGSNNSVIDSNILDQIEHTVTNNNASIIGLDGKEHATSICSITLSYKDKDYTYNYTIANMGKVFADIKKDTGVTLHGLIGSKFFNEYKYVLDFNDLIAYSKL